MARVVERAGQAGWGQCCGQSGCPTTLGSPRPTSGAEWGLSCRILGSCTGLMQAIRVLVLASKDLQREIVESGRVSQGRGMEQQGLGQLGVTTHCWGHAARSLGPLVHQHQLPGAPAPAPGSRPGCSPRGIREVPDPPFPRRGLREPPRFGVSPAPTHILNETLASSVPPERGLGGPRPPCPQHVTVPFLRAGCSISQGVLRQEFPLDRGSHLCLQGRGLGCHRHGVSATVTRAVGRMAGSCHVHGEGQRWLEDAPAPLSALPQ